jgi:hypothetical protein
MNGSLSPAAYRRLVRLNAKLSRELGFDVVPRRDPATGTFTSAGTVTGSALRASWGLFGQRANQSPAGDEFKRQLLAKLRAPRE